MSTTLETSVWHVLDVRATWVKEFASALAAQAPTLGWCPRITNGGMFRNNEEEITLDDPRLQIRYFPLQRGFAKFPVNLIAREGERLTQRLLRRTENVNESRLICSSPHYAAVAERWPGPVIYYVTDFFKAYGDDPRLIRSMDVRMCRAADLVCPNSSRISDYLIDQAECSPAKLCIIPNATRAANLVDQPILEPAASPPDLAGLSRPVAGIIGNLAANTDWELLEQTIERTPWLSWVFAGPTEMPVPEPKQNQARRSLMEHGGRVRFLGEKPYGVLRDYARALDVAILPYRKREPTYSGSATRFYEHLAACRPIIATSGVEELLHKEPLLKLIDTAEGMTSELEQLRDAGFRDGNEGLRLRASIKETWEERASAVRMALTDLVPRYQLRAAAG
jgi:glycosyltransferase involved in cell wall biosynthesis